MSRLKLLPHRNNERTDVRYYNWNGERVLRFSVERFFLTTNDIGERTERIIHGIGIGENFGHVRLQHHHVRAAPVAPEILAAHAARKVVFRPQTVIGRFS